MLAAVLLAGFPALLLGANEARRNFQLAVAERTAAADVALQAAVAQVEDSVRSATYVVDALAEQPAVVEVKADCAQTLSLAIARLERFVAASRVNAEGEVLCASRPFFLGVRVEGDPWFAALRQGAPWSASSLLLGPLTDEPVLLVGAPVRQGGRFEGAVLVSMQPAWLEERLAETTQRGRAVFVFDTERRRVAGVASELPLQEALEAADQARGNGASGGYIIRTQAAFGGFDVVLVERRALARIGLQAATVAAAPLLAMLLGVAAMWAALEAWVMRHFVRLEHKARAFAAGYASPQRMVGAPPELAHLAETLDQAFARAMRREAALAEAAESNVRLSRELHHRVKNNLQVLTSLITRQQNRAREPLVRAAVSEARARMMAVALVHRFIDPPEHLGFIDFDAYLAELCRHLHATLSGDARQIKLSLDLQGGELSADLATVIGLIVAETFVAGYSATAGLAGGVAQVVWRDAPRALTVSAGPTGRAATEVQLDSAMVSELARQAGAAVEIGPGATVQLRWP